MSINVAFFDEIEKQISLLEKHISEDLCNLQSSSLSIRKLENEIGIFLNKYYSEVGNLFEEFSNCATVLAPTSDISDNSKTDFYPHIPSEESQNIMQDYVKNLYRKLAKIYHPDVAKPHIRAEEAFSLLTDSYEKCDITTMIQIDQGFLFKNDNNNENSITRLEHLERQHKNIMLALKDLEKKRLNIINSSEYKLYQRANWHKMCGKNLIDTIKENILCGSNKKHLEVACG